MSTAYDDAYTRISGEVIARLGLAKSATVADLPESTRVRVSMLASLIVSADAAAVAQQIGRRPDIGELLKINDGIGRLLEALDIGRPPSAPPPQFRVNVVDNENAVERLHGMVEDLAAKAEAAGAYRNDPGAAPGDVVINVTPEDLAVAIGPRGHHDKAFDE
jgi:hypothetical protein